MSSFNFFSNNAGDGIGEIVDPSLRVADDADVKLYRYIPLHFTDYTEAPHNIDFETGITARLHPKVYMTFGEVTKIEYYASSTQSGFSQTYSDLILQEDFSYTRDSNGFALSRTHTITWYREDGSAHPSTKVRTKYYSADDSYREGIRRRGNIIDALIMEIAGMLLATVPSGTDQEKIQLGRNFMAYHKTNLDLFKEASNQGILYAVRDDAVTEHNTWLNNVVAAPSTTIRHVILARLNMWGIQL